MGERYTADHRGRLFNRLWPLTRYLMGYGTALFGLLLFFVLNRTTVIGRRHVPRRPGTLLLANHQSMIDSFLIGVCAYFPHALLRPTLIPWNPAAEENFYRNPVLAWLADQWKCIPVRPGRRDLKALYRMMRALEEGTMILFPEGTRSRDGEVGRGRPGAGLVALGTHPRLVPVAIEGMGDVLPIGRRFPRFCRRVFVYFGRPVDYSDLIGRPRSKETAQELVDRVMARVRRQHAALRRLARRRDARRDGPPPREPRRRPGSSPGALDRRGSAE